MKTVLRGSVLTVGNNIDTDMIVPGRYLELTDPKEIGRHCLAGISEDIGPNFPQGGIVVAGTNFGCGSSREHAAWAIAGYGFQAVISSSFADIHKQNELNNFIVPVAVSEAFLAELFRRIEKDPATEVAINLPDATVEICGTAHKERFSISRFKQYCLANALDDIDFLLENQKKTETWEMKNQEFAQ